eukprot:scaffold22592_cov129-Cylindrotheca_fusiformis.AAC.15
MTLEEKKKWFHRRRKEETIEKFIPHYLRTLVLPYHGDFCFSRVFHYKLLSQLCSEGFLPIATDGVLLPKLHAQRCVISLPEDLHVSKSTRKKAKRFNFSANKAFDRVVLGCQRQHGDRCWLYPPLVRAFKEMNERGKVDAEVFRDNGKISTGRACPVRLYSIEIWDLEGDLVAGELGYTVGSIYTSLTGFSSQDSAGSVQLSALGRLLSTLGFSLWDLGMEMPYKFSLGSKLMPRQQFLEHVRGVRESEGHLLLPTAGEGLFNARSLIDQTEPKSLDVQHASATAESNIENTSPVDKETKPPQKKRPKSSNAS